ncbi:MAG: peptidase dimerization domain-containing protein [Chloroflexota bacterium]|nr:peptidase dimerization domain-containing protein [Dehalococcoidia bacterium]MDW8252815.1 peptidase dimerization domain-containing protein [Chloroflexota bacterium]
MTLRKRHLAAVDEAARTGIDRLAALAGDLANCPEPGFAEYGAAARLTGALSAAGFTVEQPIAGLDTAFRASLGQGRPALAIFLEYDAHPEAGHLAGKHLAAAASVSALAALAAVGDIPGRLLAIGAPASEPDQRGAGGKALLLERGLLDEVDAAFLLVATNSRRPRLTSAPAGQLIELRFTGKASHAASAPERGINALEAALGTFLLINAARQHLPPGARIDGVVPNGGAAPNIVPEKAAARFWVRAPEPFSLRRAARRLVRAAEASAAAAGATVEREAYSRLFLNFIDCPPLGEPMADAWRRVYDGDPSGPWELSAPTDFGNVSQVIPALLVPLFVSEAPPKTPEFAAATMTKEAVAAAAAAARALALGLAALFAAPDRIAAGAADLAARQERLRAVATAAAEF